MKINNFEEMINQYETNCQNTDLPEYVDSLYTLSFSVACAFLNTTISKTGNQQLQDLKTDLCRDYSNIRRINSGDSTNIDYLIRIPIRRRHGLSTHSIGNYYRSNQTKREYYGIYAVPL